MDGMCPLESLLRNARNAIVKVQDWMRILWIKKLKDASYAVDGKWNTTNAEPVNNEIIG